MVSRTFSTVKSAKGNSGINWHTDSGREIGPGDKGVSWSPSSLCFGELRGEKKAVSSGSSSADLVGEGVVELGVTGDLSFSDSPTVCANSILFSARYETELLIMSKSSIVLLKSQ